MYSQGFHLTSNEFVAQGESHVHQWELNMNIPDYRISSISPHSASPRSITPPPPPAYCVERPGLIGTEAERSEHDHQLSRQRSYSAMSFHVPRRHPDGFSSTAQEETPPRIPAKSKYRARACTAPEVNAIKERVASALIEVERLQQQIDDVIERQSIYASSRPSTSHSIAHTMPEPMPSIPALPPAAPSFAERLNAETERPQTAPIKTPNSLTSQGKFSYNQHNTAIYQHQGMHEEQPLPPPLPLVLRPPLRKKKSFSRVSKWLSLSQEEQGKNASFDSITNNPKPIKGNSSFYQIVSANGQSGQQSYESFDSLSTCQTDDGESTAPTKWSPGSISNQKRNETALQRTATFGKNDARLGKPPVGFAI
ncbi:hypothetical protein QQS21_006506 [Conoideocrella luteorostrata]|uniref:Uncharacterized protein n=1 Tax=Conoideocrella luteorostrata TaxID=1105319 RepID=A0AAJ0FTB9_9HYPO|nr:hypothetical protein QQS21_006506 [Conoideocrella luteorostrata]